MFFLSKTQKLCNEGNVITVYHKAQKRNDGKTDSEEKAIPWENERRGGEGGREREEKGEGEEERREGGRKGKRREGWEGEEREGRERGIFLFPKLRSPVPSNVEI